MKNNKAERRGKEEYTLTIDAKEVTQIVITTTDGEVLSVVSDSEVIAKDGISVTLDFV